MQDSGSPRLQAYERALARLHELQGKVHDQLTMALRSGESSRFNLRDLAYTEGLRSERDKALDEVRRLEAELFNDVAAQTMGSSKPTDSVK